MFSKTSRLYGSISTSVVKNFSSTVHSQIAIIGGGCAGVNVAAQLLRNGVLPQHIRIFEPSKFHHYQPGWTMVGGGLAQPGEFIESTLRMIPKHVQTTDIAVSQIDPANRFVRTEDGSKWTYDHLVVATGIQNNYDAIKGLEAALENPEIPVGTIYSQKYTQKWSSIRENFNGQKAFFTQPPPPIKCAGAPQKIMYLSQYYWNQKGRKPDVGFYIAPPVMFGQPENAKTLYQMATGRGIDVRFEHNLVEVRGNDRVAVFQDLKNKTNIEVNFDALHVTPYQKPQDFIAKQTQIVDAAGYVDVDPNTLQSTRYNNVWSLGDCSNLPTSKTASAILSQTPVLVHNLLKVLREDASREAFAGYFGYTACPILTGGNKVQLAEFKYGNVLDETFPPLQYSKKPNSFFYLLKRHVFPFAYFKLMPRGLWYGRTGVIPPSFKDVHGERY